MQQSTTTVKLTKKTVSIQELHKYVIWGVGIWIIFVLTFVSAYYRVSKSEKFDGMPYKTLTDEDSQKPAESYPNN
ncbi:MAG: hypothetical protein F6J94_07385 [Moorea sp. SIO1F2]|uniref:hypothetical protein n=1 Tax=unclassified Moorena TaxID=2683338 RepID=UPI0013B5E69A|nr:MULTISPECIES: hypothetical protein [unclassified Moorena]NEN96985.1 hypothetical protein [Moorena sp. SIO3I7]NEO05829.1 hypothetical protein [Moorena sp. SIO3I8]NEO20221.1 hypothetical protein [Moorena sp. SIO4A5]NEP22669.1 hypothetical protein [Moorena sp. SIO3I6]NET81783.1 hypothetical protein [Moorena sp. SIO1F2]